MHLKPFFGTKLLTDIGPDDVGVYRDERLRARAADKTVALELGTLRAILIYNDLDATWRAIRKKIKLGKAKKIGRVLSAIEEAASSRNADKAGRARCTWP